MDSDVHRRHPDDEDGTSLIVCAANMARIQSVCSQLLARRPERNRPELYEELGAIRARETMAAAEIQGSEPYFLGLKDFGYSKSADEAFRFWGHEEALPAWFCKSEASPDVIITTTPLPTTTTVIIRPPPGWNSRRLMPRGSKRFPNS